MPDNTDLVKIIRDIVRQELSKSKRITTNDIRSIGGTLYLNSAEDIRIQTAGTHKAYYNGTEIGITSGTITGSGTSPYLAKFTGASAIGNSSIQDSGSLVSVENDLKLYKASGSNYKLTFQHPTGGSAQKAEMYLFTGLTVYDFYLYSAGRLEIHALSGVLFDDAMAGNIAMGGYKLTGLGAGSGAGDSVRYEQVLLLAGGTMSGAIAMGSQKITGLAAGSVNGDALRYEQLIGASGERWLNDAHTAWLIMNGNDCELHLPAGGAFVTVIE